MMSRNGLCMEDNDAPAKVYKKIYDDRARFEKLTRWFEDSIGKPKESKNCF